MKDIKCMTLPELSEELSGMGERGYRAEQVFAWIHKGVTGFAQMSNLPKELREKLGEQYFITVPRVARKQVSRLDGTMKYLWELH